MLINSWSFHLSSRSSTSCPIVPTLVQLLLVLCLPGPALAGEVAPHAVEAVRHPVSSKR